MFFKNYNPVIRLFSYIMVLSIITLVFINTAKAVNPTPHNAYRNWMDSEDETGTVAFDANFWDPYDSGWDNVYTDNNQVKIPHSVVENDWPRGGHTAEEAKRYFDDYWSDYDASDGTADPKYNCASYATGRTDYWIQDMEEILDNDYESPDESNIDIGVWSGHVCLIGEFTYDSETCELIITNICWKDRGSAFFDYYTSYWDLKLSPYYTSMADLYAEK